MNSVNAALSKNNRLNWGWFPLISLLGALGLLSVAIGDALGRVGAAAGPWFFWTGLVLVIVPIAFRLTALDLSRRERIALVVLAGLILYLVKVLQSPFGFTFTDEYVHSFNVAQIMTTGSLFHPNPILPATPYFPGLEIVTAALASFSGLSIFTAGLIVIGMARLILMLSLYFFYEYIGRSEWVAGIASLLYVCNPNFLFWSSQFSYESLALPLVFLVLFIIARRESSTFLAEYRGLTFAAVLVILAIVFTHHLSSYFLAAFLLIWGLATLLFHQARRASADRPAFDQQSDPSFANSFKRKGPIMLAILTLVLAAVWLVVTAKTTGPYLAPIFTSGIKSILKIISGVQAPRGLFSPTGQGSIPAWQRIVAFGSVILMVLGLPLGLRTWWKRYRASGVIFLLVLIGLAYFGILTLRLSPQTWEIANRASEYLFLGLAFLLAIGALGMTGPPWLPRLRRVIVPASLVVIFLGGVISGWSPSLALQQPAQVKVGNAILVPQGQAVARWFLAELGPGNRIGADPTTARLLLTYGGQYAYAGSTPDIQDILSTFTFPKWQLQELTSYSIPYLVVDERPVARNAIAASSFDLSDPPDPASPLEVKFGQYPGVSLLLDSGNIQVYAIGAVLPK